MSIRSQTLPRPTFENAAVRLHGQLLRFVAGSMSQWHRQHTSPEDILQNAMVKAFRGWDKFDPAKGPVEEWMRRRVEDERLDDVKRLMCLKRDARRDAAAPAGDEAWPDPHTTPTGAARRDEEQSRVREVISQLSEEHREVMTMIRIKGLKVTAAAKELHIGRPNVSKRLAKALLAFRAAWEAKYGPAGVAT